MHIFFTNGVNSSSLVEDLDFMDKICWMAFFTCSSMEMSFMSYIVFASEDCISTAVIIDSILFSLQCCRPVFYLLDYSTVYFAMLAIVAIIAAIDDMLEPMPSISAGLVRRLILLGTTISQPGSTFAFDDFDTMPFM